MSYRIEKGERLPAAFGRIAHEQIRRALAELRRSNDGAAMHNVRKALKRLRALLRCSRGAFPEKVYQREKRRLALAARGISAQRDVHVQLLTLAKLREGSQPAGRAVGRKLRRRQKRFTRKVNNWRRGLRQILRRGQRALSAWPWEQITPEKMAVSLKRSYKKGRICHRASSRRPTPENLHEWRKKVKALGYGLELMQDLGPRKLAKTRHCCAELGEVLGDDHDLFMVLESLRRERAAATSAGYQRLAAHIAAKREKLARRALKLGGRLYEEKPRAFRNRFDTFSTDGRR